MTLGIAAPPSMELLSREPTSAMPEADLFRSYGPPIVSRACLCGGRIESIERHEAIAEAVSVHNSSTIHQHWAIAAGWR